MLPAPARVLVVTAALVRMPVPPMRLPPAPALALALGPGLGPGLARGLALHQRRALVAVATTLQRPASVRLAGPTA